MKETNRLIFVWQLDGECKFWLEPVQLARNKGLAPHMLREIERLIFEHLEFLKEKYNEYHNN